MYCVMQSMTRTSQQVRRGVLEKKYGVEFNSLEILKTIYLVYIENHAFVPEITDEQMRLLKKISVSLEYK